MKKLNNVEIQQFADALFFSQSEAKILLIYSII